MVKGSPEKIRELSVPNSIPQDYDQVLSEYTERGYRVLAIAYRNAPTNLNLQDLLVLPRAEAEKDLIFLGFLVMQNKLKAATVRSIKDLNEADVRTIMATGDNMLTAISVGRKCGIV